MSAAARSGEGRSAKAAAKCADEAQRADHPVTGRAEDWSDGGGNRDIEGRDPGTI
jgi:hypothetical protein